MCACDVGTAAAARAERSTARGLGRGTTDAARSAAGPTGRGGLGCRLVRHRGQSGPIDRRGRRCGGRAGGRCGTPVGMGPGGRAGDRAPGGGRRAARLPVVPRTGRPAGPGGRRGRGVAGGPRRRAADRGERAQARLRHRAGPDPPGDWPGRHLAGVGAGAGRGQRRCGGGLDEVAGRDPADQPGPVADAGSRFGIGRRAPNPRRADDGCRPERTPPPGGTGARRAPDLGAGPVRPNRGPWCRLWCWATPPA